MAEKVLVAMSGGVDSSVAAYLLQQQGYACIGVTMRLYENETAGIPRGHTCCSLDDVEDARAVAYDLGMPYYVLNFTEEFDEKVIRKFVQVYQNGGTPNPCIDCNRYLKFDHLLNRARELGCDYIATGHYVQRWQDENGRWGLRKNDDPGKDQSYVLYSLTQDQLAHTLFPLGGMHKDAVRAIAEEQGLCNARKHDSQDICFVPDGDYAAFLERYTGQPMQPGNFVDEQGHVIGRHKGAARYTIGQRKGLGISAETRLFVSGKNMAENTVTVGLESALFHSSLLADEWNWIAAPPAVGQPLPCTARTRYHQPEHRYPAAGWPRAGGFCRPPARHCPRPGRCAVQRRKRNRRRNDFECGIISEYTKNRGCSVFGRAPAAVYFVILLFQEFQQRNGDKGCHNAAANGFDQRLHADKGADEQERVGGAEGCAERLHILGIKKEHAQRKHEPEGVQQRRCHSAHGAAQLGVFGQQLFDANVHPTGAKPHQNAGHKAGNKGAHRAGLQHGGAHHTGGAQGRNKAGCAKNTAKDGTRNRAKRHGADGNRDGKQRHGQRPDLQIAQRRIVHDKQNGDQQGKLGQPTGVGTVFHIQFPPAAVFSSKYSAYSGAGLSCPPVQVYAV